MNKMQFVHPRDQIVAFMQRIYDYGMTTTSGGNLSIMDSDGNMWISPASVDKGTLRREDIVCVKADGSIEGRHKPSSEYPFHRAIYKMRSDVRAILHAHPPALVSFSVAGRIPNTMVNPTAALVCGGVGYARYAVPGSEALGKEVAAEFAKGFNTILLENHGTCVSGLTLQQAFERFETLDYCARLLNNACRIGEPKYLSEADLELVKVDRNAGFGSFVPEAPSSAELELRYQTAALIRRSYKQKLFNCIEGSYAVRLDKESFLVTPSGADRAVLQPEDLVLIRNGKVAAGAKPSRCAWFFKAVFDAQSAINSIIVANPPSLMAYAAAHVEFNPRVIPESYLLLREMPSFRFGTQYRELEKITSTLSVRHPVVLIDNDSVITSGRTPLEAFDRLEVAEYSAKATLRAGLLGGMTPINPAQVAEIVEAFKLIP